ncbi:MAG: NACHT domain-containing protein, partial [Acidobacteria bacterium]|nr:NACHT domain-containing protein [Acidobacteriota bacterium]
MPYYVTFYSFKGGVGRTHTLVNTALMLRNLGHQVLIWEADLEAPSLLNLPVFEKARGEVKLGLIDALTGAAGTVECITECQGLRILPAGQPGKTYEATYGRFQEKFATDATALALKFDQIRAQIDTLPVDIVLIDSRTGFTDLGAICTVQLAHLVVLVFRLGQQDLEGTRWHWTLDTARMKRIGRRVELQTRLVAAMVPEDQPDLVMERLKAAKEAGLEVKYRVPLIPEFMLYERMPAADFPGWPITQVYRDLAADIEGLARQQKIEQEPAAAKPQVRDRDKQGREFEDKVAAVLRLMGFEVKTDLLIEGRQVDFLAVKRDTLQETHWLGECKDHAKDAGVDTLDALHSGLRAYQRSVPQAQGLIVARTGFTKEATAHAKSLGIALKTYSELLDGLVDLRFYVPSLIRDVTGQDIERLYVDPTVFPESTRQLTSLDAFMDQWLNEASSTHLTLLGDYGTGKTWFTRRWAARLAEAYQKDPARNRCPIRIDLRAAARALSLENALYEHFQRQSGRLVDPKAVLHLLSEGRCVLIFDAFDEMATQANWDVTVQNFRELTRAAQGRAKVVLTCRTHFFRTQDEVAALVEGRQSGISPEARSLYAEVFGKTGFSVAYLRDFDARQINHYLKLAGAEAVIPLFDQISGLKEIAGRPVLLDMVVKSAPALKGRERVKLATLYETYTEEWLQRADWRSSLDREGRRRMAQEIAVRLWETDGARMHHSELRAVAGLLRDRAKNLDEVDVIESEVRTASFFTWKDGEGNYGFSHRSFLEFFLAQWVARNMQAGPSVEALRLRRLSPEVMGFLVDLCPREALERCVHAVFEGGYVPRASENALLLYQAAGLARPRRFELAGAELAGWRLPGLDLTGANLRGAKLGDADLAGACVEGADLCEAVFTRAMLDGVRARGARCVGADLSGASMVDADFEGAAVEGADFRFALAVRARMPEVSAMGLSRRMEEAVRPVVQSFVREGEMCVAWHPSAPLLAVTAGTAIVILDAVTLSVHRALEGHTYWVRSVSWRGDGKQLASGGDQTVRVWDVESGRGVRVLEGHAGTVGSVSWRGDGKQLASGGDDSTVLVWDVESDRGVRVLEGHAGAVESVSWRGDGKQLASGGDDSTVLVWDMESGRGVRVLEGHAGAVQSVSWRGDGKQLASG